MILVWVSIVPLLPWLPAFNEQHRRAINKSLLSSSLLPLIIIIRITATTAGSSFAWGRKNATNAKQHHHSEAERRIHSIYQITNSRRNTKDEVTCRPTK